MIWNCHGVSYYGKWLGNGDEVLVFLHGFTGTHRTWIAYEDNLSDHFRILMVDLLGHGQTDAPAEWKRYDITKVASDIIAILNQLNIKKAHLAGYSMGGRVAITIAILYPERVASLLLESSTPGIIKDEERKERRQHDVILAKQLLQNGLEAFIDYWEHLPLFTGLRKLNLSQQQAIRKERLSHNPIGLANSLIGMGTGAMPSWWEKLPLLSMPVQLITGENDAKFVQIANQMTNYNPKFQHTIIPNAGHTVHLEQPEAFLNVLKRFYSSQNQ